MKELYERPMIAVEEFTVNRAIAACGDETSKAITFDCMIGPNVDTTNVLTADSNCRRQAGITTLKTASTTESNSHSNHTQGTWGTLNGARTYTAPSNAIGLVYFCSAVNGSSDFSEKNGVLTHTGRHGGNYHVQVAPLYGTSIEEVNVGS